MGRFVRGDVVVVPFPISRPPEYKKRPALIVGTVPYATSTDYIFCMITTQQTAPDSTMIKISDEDLDGGALRRPSCVRPNYLWTGIENDVISRVATLDKSKLDLAILRIIQTIDPASAP